MGILRGKIEIVCCSKNGYLYLSFLFRRENKPFLDVVLSEESRQKRNRQKRISIQITAFSWFLEFIFGSAKVIDYFFLGLSLSNSHKWLLILDVFLCSVVIPSSYIFKTEAMKDIVFRKGWQKIGRDLFPIKNSRVVPIAE